MNLFCIYKITLGPGQDLVRCGYLSTCLNRVWPNMCSESAVKGHNQRIQKTKRLGHIKTTKRPIPPLFSQRYKVSNSISGSEILIINMSLIDSVAIAMP